MQLVEMGLRIPQDISLLGFGSATNRDGALAGRLTSVTMDEQQVGSRAAELLEQMKRGDRAIDDNEEIQIPLSLSEGQTLGSVSFVRTGNQ